MSFQQKMCLLSQQVYFLFEKRDFDAPKRDLYAKQIEMLSWNVLNVVQIWQEFVKMKSRRAESFSER